MTQLPTHRKTVSGLDIRHTKAEALLSFSYSKPDFKGKPDQKAVKGQVLAEFWADHPLPAKWEVCDKLPEEDVMNVEVMPRGKCTLTKQHTKRV
ncbi:hypothetical protein LIER_30009 [Lithospermum erythrorhizon]|uniref:Uncharacterized protein n=1 Tax=Lithospermum erythrorhizon TaxID=34254 RepID=A0AAV3RS20_LITER